VKFIAELFLSKFSSLIPNMVSTRQLVKAQFNRSLPRDLTSPPEGKIFKFVEIFATKNDRRPPVGKFCALQTTRVHQAQLKTGTSNARILSSI